MSFSHHRFGERSRQRSSFFRSERLERRLHLAAVTWDAGGDGTNWRDPLNWSNDAIPTSADDLTIDLSTTSTVAITHGQNLARSLNCSIGLSMTGGSLAVTAPSAVSGSFSMNANSWLGGSGSFTLSGAATIAGGTMAIGGKTIIAPGSTLTITGNANLNLARTLENYGTLDWAGSADIAMNTAIILNRGTIRHTASPAGFAQYSSASGVNNIINDGAIELAGTVSTVEALVPIVNNGSILAHTGTLRLGGGLTQNGTLTVDTGAVIRFTGSATYLPGSILNGTGGYEFTAGTHSLEADRYQHQGLTSVSGTVSLVSNVALSQLSGSIAGTATFNLPVTFVGDLNLAGTIRFASTTPTSLASVTVASGVTTFDSPAALSISTLTVTNGKLSTPGDVSVTDAATLKVGGVLGDGTLEFRNTAVVTLIAGSTQIEKDVRNQGIILVTATHTFQLNGSQFDNSGSISILAPITFDLLGGVNRFINNGTLSGLSATFRVPVTNNGQMTATGGTFTFSASPTALTNAGTLNIAAAAILKLGTSLLLPASVIQGDGTTDFTNGGINTLDATTFQMNGTWTFSGGTVTFNLPRTFASAQTISGNVTFNQPVSFLSTSTFSGTATFNDSVSFQGKPTFNGTAFLNGSSVFGTDAAFGGTTTITGLPTFAGNISINGRLNVSTSGADVSLNNVAFNVGTLGGSANVIIRGVVTNVGGMTMDGAGVSTIAAGASLNVGGVFNLSRNLVNNGIAYFPHEIQDIYFTNATFTNNGEFRAGGDATIDRFIGVAGTNLFINNGTFAYAGNYVHNVSIEVPFENHGLVQLTGGDLRFIASTNASTGSPLSGGRYVTSAGTVLRFFIPLTTLTADIDSAGQIYGLESLANNRGRLSLKSGTDLTVAPATGTFVNEGAIELSTGSVFTVNGNLRLAGEIGPSITTHLANAIDFGKVSVTGAIDLNCPDSTSTLRGILDGSYNPSPGGTHAVISATSGIVSGFDAFTPTVTPLGHSLIAIRPDATTFSIGVGSSSSAAPLVTGVSFSDETAQRLAVTFDSDARAFLSRKDLVLTNLDTASTVSQSIGTFTYDALTNVASLTVTGLLPDAHYRVIVRGDAVANPAGIPSNTADQFLDFNLLRGDLDHDGTVGFDDLLILSQNYGLSGRTYSQGNIDYSSDGSVNFDDLLALSQSYGNTLVVRKPVTATRSRRLID